MGVSCSQTLVEPESYSEWQRQYNEGGSLHVEPEFWREPAGWWTAWTLAESFQKTRTAGRAASFHRAAGSRGGPDSSPGRERRWYSRGTRAQSCLATAESTGVTEG